MNSFTSAIEIFLLIIVIALTLAMLARCWQCLLSSNKLQENEGMNSEFNRVCVISENPYLAQNHENTAGITYYYPQLVSQGARTENCRQVPPPFYDSQTTGLNSRDVDVASRNEPPPSYMEVVVTSVTADRRLINK